MQRFSDRRILVTGGASGIGAGIARRLADEGAVVTVLDLQPVASAEADIFSVQGSVADEAAVMEAVRVAAGADGRLHGLVNNAGVMGSNAIEALTFEEWHHVLDVNVGGYMLAARHAFGPMRAAGGGTIINCSSIMAFNSGPGQAAYSASKSAVLGLTRGVAMDGAAHGIRCNAVCPGTIETPMYQRYLARHEDPRAEHQRHLRMYPLGRLGTAADVAGLVAFLLSDDAAWITGQDFVIDGGFLAAGTVR